MTQIPDFFFAIKSELASLQKKSGIFAARDKEKRKIGLLIETCRGIAFTQKSINFKTLFNRECYAQTSQRSHKILIKAKRVEHLQIEISVESFKMVAQMLNPYIFLKYWEICLDAIIRCSEHPNTITVRQNYEILCETMRKT